MDLESVCGYRLQIQTLDLDYFQNLMETSFSKDTVGMFHAALEWKSAPQSYMHFTFCNFHFLFHILLVAIPGGYARGLLPSEAEFDS